jgi:hypothetical protein
VIKNCNWEEIDGFQSYFEFKKFIEWIESQIIENMVSEIPVKDSYAGSGFNERWFQCLSSKSVWRLVYPDGPFHGYWGAVT